MGELSFLWFVNVVQLSVLLFLSSTIKYCQKASNEHTYPNQKEISIFLKDYRYDRKNKKNDAQDYERDSQDFPLSCIQDFYGQIDIPGCCNLAINLLTALMAEFGIGL